MRTRTSEAADERAHIVALLRRWATHLDPATGMWPGVTPNHAALLRMLAHVLEGND